MSAAVRLPHVAFSRVQKAWSASGVHEQTFVAPHVDVPAHRPHSAVRATPHASVPLTWPQFFWSREQNAASVSAQPHRFAMPAPPQLAGIVQLPHVVVRISPHVSAAVTGPHWAPTRMQNATSVSPAQPQTLTVPPPPHVAGIVHVPHETVRDTPQLSAAVTEPQLFPSRVQNAVSVSAAHEQTFAVPPPPHVAGMAQVPHETVR